ncbi:chalcone isomerase family protein [Endozoicomonas gorgoniicola]|uniref:Chalcone isomerase family protein n=1 Tax=Endozoicomonas gorgoniicola TaxID=1234144 RepID=A0ABT3MQT1_9GAMM|nr:chalcone isomerase family protein [Endozoicomonas gorgoniicola]MCW7551724.1 chalcone isomerase family protein [Endozoicomonas gorgoniicola]
MKKLAVLFASLLMSFTLHAKEVGGVPIEDQLIIDNQTLALNGAGIRKKFFMDLYVGSLYTQNRTSDANTIINSKAPMAMQLDILSGMITSEKMASTIKEGFETATGGNMAPVRERLDKFIGVFNEKIEKGDRFIMMMVPGEGLMAYKNGKHLATVKGDDFGRTLFKIWLGEKPADRNLKRSMLNG